MPLANHAPRDRTPRPARTSVPPPILPHMERTSVVGRQDRAVVLQLPFLIYREEITPAKTIWFARSVATSDLGFGSTDKEAIQALREILELSMVFAHSKGLGPSDWLATQTPDEPRWIEQWTRLWVPDKSASVVRMHSSGGFEAEAKIARNAA